MPIQQYIDQIKKHYRTGISREHSNRGDLQNLLQELAAGILVTNEPARVQCGAPDYTITRKITKPVPATNPPPIPTAGYGSIMISTLTRCT